MLWSVGAQQQQKQSSDVSFKNEMGRPRGEHNLEAQQSWIPQLSHLLHESQPSHSTHKNNYKLKCKGPKHCAQVSVRSANYSATALACHVCKGQGSKPERLLYELLDKEECVQLYAVESFSLVQKAQVSLQDGTVICPNLKRWDVTTLQPPGLLVEVQGEGHSSKLVTRRNNTDDTITNRQLKDIGYAEAAQREGWSVLWLWWDEGCTKPHTLAEKWAAELRKAVEHVVAGGKPELFST